MIERRADRGGQTVRTVRTARDGARDDAEREPAPRDLVYVALCGDAPCAGAMAVEVRPGEVLVIGRGVELELGRHEGEAWLRVPDSRVSERHAVVDHRGETLTIEDLGSLNGTYVGGQPVKSAELEDGGTAVVGRTVLLLRRGLIGARVGPPSEVVGAPELRTLSPELEAIHARLARVAPSDVSVLLRGETGTGKEIAARALHALSRRAGRFVAVNCGALPEGLVESELFGHRRGAFSGATAEKVGLIAGAAGGTLLLDEIGELPPPAQVKLLRALQERTIHPLGTSGGEGTPVDFRLVCATHADLAVAVTRERFRNDLYARLRGLEIELVPLRARPMDVGLLVGALLTRLAGDVAPSYRFDRRCAEALVRHDYPLNVRELEQMLKTLLALAGPERLLRREALTEAGLGPGPRGPGARGAVVAAVASDADLVRAELLEKLERHRGNISEVARSMRRTRMQVHRWLKRWHIDIDRFRPPR